MKQGAVIGKYSEDNTDNSPGTGQKQRQPEQSPLRGRVPEEEFAEEVLHFDLVECVKIMQRRKSLR